MKTFLFFLLFFILGNRLIAQQTGYVNHHVIDPYNPRFVPGEVLVKFKDEIQLQVSMHKNTPQTGLTSIDRFIARHNVTSCAKVFANEQKRTTLRMMTTSEGRTIEVPQLFNIYKFKAQDSANVKVMVEELKQDPIVDYAEPNYYFYTQELLEKGFGIPDEGYWFNDSETSPQYPASMSFSPSALPHPSQPPLTQTVTPNDPLYSQQWYLPAIGAPAAWDSTTGDTSIVIAIIDTGVDWDHPDLDDNIWINWDEVPSNGIDDDGNGKVDDIRGWDFVGNDNNPNDDNSHGTHVAGIAAAESNNGIGIAGIAWNSQIMPVKVLQSTGTGTSTNIANGINYAYQNQADIINLSLGGPYSLTIMNAILNAYAVGSACIAAAGNDYYSIEPLPNPIISWARIYPASFTFVLGIQATKQTYDNIFGWLATFSNYDLSGPFNSTEANYELKAPGCFIISTLPGGTYGTYSGTSMATPIVSGIFALLKARFPNEVIQQFWLRLVFSQGNWVNAFSALNYVMPPPDLSLLSLTIYDQTGDNDGKADAGELIKVCPLIKNIGGVGTDLWGKICFHQYEDTTKATIITDSVWIGSIGTLATMASQDSINIVINSTLGQGVEIWFDLQLFEGNDLLTTQDMIFTVERTADLIGIVDSIIYLTPDRYWIIGSQFRLDGSNAKMIILPGTSVYCGGEILKVNGAKIIAIGTADSIINIECSTTSIDTLIYCHCQFFGSNEREIKYIQNSYVSSQRVGVYNKGLTAVNSTFILSASGTARAYLEYASNCKVVSTTGVVRELWSRSLTNSFIEGTTVEHWANTPLTMNANYCHFYNSPIYSATKINGKFNNYLNSSAGVFNNIGYGSNFVSGSNIIKASSGTNVYFPNRYWGTTKSTNIDLMVVDFWDDPNLAILHYNPIDSIPSDSAHGFVHQLLIDDVNPYDQTLDPLGSGVHKFAVVFNKPMDTAFHPILSFGPTFPYTQVYVNDSSSWSSDHKVFTAYETFSINIFDGINKIIIKGAKDTTGMECPPEDYRYKMTIQVAGSLSEEFIATPGIGKVSLEWPPSPIEGAMGYNLYRSMRLTATNWSSFQLQNQELIIDTIYTDFNVIPDSLYKYCYKTVKTDLAESDASKTVLASPFSAANGDANGDSQINVLDITAVIAYMLNQNPQPFLFDAADVNGDNVINVLDIIGIVNIIVGKKKLVSSTIGTNSNPAYIWLDDGQIRFKSEGQVAALQFELTGQNLEQIRLLMKQQGFELATGIVKGKLTGIIYNLENRTIPEGMLDLIGMEGKTKPLAWGDVTAGDPQGQYVLVLKDAKDPVTLSTTELTAIPNPFKDRITITYRLIEQASIQLEVFDSQGKLTRILESAEKPAGSYSVEWDGRNIAPGIYYCRLKGSTLSGQDVKSEIKILLTK